MKTILKPLLVAIAFGASALVAAAQSPKILVVDMAQLYDNHYKTEEHTAKLRGDEQRAQEELEKLNAEGNRLVEQYKELDDQSKNPAISNDAKAKAEQDAQAIMEQIQRKQNEMQSFRANAQRTLQQRLTNFRDLLLEEISKTASEVARQQGATLLLDKSGPSLIGISSLIYADSALEITDAVAAEINRTRPAAAASGTSGTGSTTTTPSTPAPADEPTVTFPGAKKK